MMLGGGGKQSSMAGHRGTSGGSGSGAGSGIGSGRSIGRPVQGDAHDTRTTVIAATKARKKNRPISTKVTHGAAGGNLTSTSLSTELPPPFSIGIFAKVTAAANTVLGDIAMFR